MKKQGEVKKAAKAAYQKCLAGADRQKVLEELMANYGKDGIFSFGQAEYYSKKRQQVTNPIRESQKWE